MAESIRSAAIVRGASEHAAEVAARIAEAARHVGMTVGGTWIVTTDGLNPDPRHESICCNDAIFAVGGDGFLLDVVRWRAILGSMPIVGWNAGRVGFLMNAVSEGTAGLIADLADLTHGRYESVPLHRLRATVRTADGASHDLRAFNEFAIRALRGQAAHLEVAVDESDLGVWAGDGLAVATTQGSTGYNLNAGGAVLDWTLPAFTVVMSNPLRHRAYASPQMPMVFLGSSTFRVTVGDPEKRPVFVVADGDRARVDHAVEIDIAIARDEQPIPLCFPFAQGERGGRRFLRQFSRAFLGIE